MERRAMRRRTMAVLAAFAGVALVASGCSSGGEGGPDPAEEGDEALEAVDETQSEDDVVVEAEEAGGTGDGLDPLPVEPQQIDATVHIGGLEYTIDALDVIDLDAEAGQSQRLQGATVVVTGSVLNPGAETAVPNAGFMLQWEQADTGHTFEARSRPDMGNPMPAGSSGPVEAEISLNPEQLDSYDQDHATLLVGNPDRSPAAVPLGSQGELISRIPVPQTELIGATFDVDGQVAVTILEADLRWDPDNGTENGTAILEIDVEVQNEAGMQQCWRRGTGTNFSLTAADGTGTADLSMSDRGCAATGESVISRTGIPVHEDYAGEYTLTLDYEIVAERDGAGEFQVPLEFTMVEEPAVLMSER